MDNQLNLLLSLFKEEKVRLELIIKNYLKEQEYLPAHYHSEALALLNKKIQTLNNLNDQHFDLKFFKNNWMEHYKKSIQKEDSEFMKEFYQKELQKVEKELEDLNQLPKTNESYQPVLNDILIRLINNQIKNVTLILNKKDQLAFKFSYSSKVFKITFPHINKHTERLVISPENVSLLKALGFQSNDDQTKLIFTATGNKETILSQINFILGKIIFEVFYFKNFENESFIKFTDKT